MLYRLCRGFARAPLQEQQLLFLLLHVLPAVQPMYFGFLHFVFNLNYFRVDGG